MQWQAIQKHLEITAMRRVKDKILVEGNSSSLGKLFFGEIADFTDFVSLVFTQEIVRKELY